MDGCGRTSGGSSGGGGCGGGSSSGRCSDGSVSGEPTLFGCFLHVKVFLRLNYNRKIFYCTYKILLNLMLILIIL